MAYTPIENYNITGVDDVFVYLANNVPIFIPAMLIFIWISVTSLIYFGTRKFAGQGDFFAATSAAGYLTVVLATAMTLGFGFINWYTLGIIIGIFIFSTIFLLIRRSRD